MGTVGGVRARAGLAFAVVDEAEQPLLLVRTEDESRWEVALEAVREQAAELPVEVPYLLLASPERIGLFDGDAQPLAELATADVLATYHPEYQRWRVTPRYLAALVEAWLGDLAWRWRGETPPGDEALAECGLVERLRAGVLHVVPDEQGGLRP